MATVRRQDEYDRDLSLAWHIEALRRQKVLKPLRSLLARTHRSATKPQSLNAQRTVLHVLSAQYGIPLTVGKKG